ASLSSLSPTPLSPKGALHIVFLVLEDGDNTAPPLHQKLPLSSSFQELGLLPNHGSSRVLETLFLFQECVYCGISFFDKAMHFLHRRLHAENSSWICNFCGTHCEEKYMFNAHVFFANHSAYRASPVQQRWYYF
ncbi:unnamed protein product, partial [Haemonchus placei]|uniref:C2H2-type domain-containing protein n=1 Tax=Haemonchus placei TaxID=6290 RepID=A0A0N4X0C8_HAEPC